MTCANEQLNLPCELCVCTQIYRSVLQEADETAYWLELLVRAGIALAEKLDPLRKEIDEIIAILVTIVTKVKKRIGKI